MIEGHGDDSYKYKRPITANFSSNVYSKVDLSCLKAHLCAHIESIGNYPEPEPYTLEARLATEYHLPADAVCVTNGATEAIYLIAQTFRGTNTAIVQPTFSEYADACRMHGHKITSLYRLPEAKDGYLLPEKVQMLWLCNPNNPTGTVVDKKYLTELIRHNSKVGFVIDQSYEYFTLHPLFSPSEAVEFPNVLLLHSMTKRYAVPGLRLGYVTGNGGLLKRLRVNRMPWSVNQLAIEAGLYLLENDVPNSLDVSGYLQETARLCAVLGSVGGLEVWATETHFMLVRLRFGKASALKEYLAGEHGILIRDASNFDGLDEHFFRIATQTREENDRLVDAIKQWMVI
ncbi:threonine-phosphate decarboxylase [Bacteroides helcogenes]|uniref:Aminotransferase n=1 Tax=Bacteroides helcogenes (strain ATCC 35417 / DSM 20613 / JCM 6297 / CCUG 15421 / P 36-108) TaxID=693979 RepID=E6SSZ3_BACT6|nr:threonine-phosphate decarboxylase [Bacteroides helcogenes]ADV44224.1 L-threonine O-3-phosphate decarboxylase [Bacteroides helcogenes P 36-108]MDY5238362.1 threonine-phosphate decarboxylase [Bacteroides helcogenes]